MEKGIILGLCMGHNPSVAIVQDGKVRFAVEQEKCSGAKNTVFYVKEAIEEGISSCDISSSEITEVAIHSDPRLYHGINRGALPRRYELMPCAYCYALKHILSSRSWLSYLGLPKRVRISFYSHHKSHAAESFFQSGFKKAAILVIDGRGESESTSFWTGDGTSINHIRSFPVSQSIGYFYLILTSFLGFRYGDEYKVMGLSSYGKPRYKAKMLSLFRQQDMIHRDYFLFRLGLHAFGLSKHPGSPPAKSPFAAFGSGSAMPFGQKADVAASLQAATEEIALGYAKEIYDQTEERNLCLSGGVAQNSVLNGKIAALGIFDDVYVSSCPNDGGTSLGAALLCFTEKEGRIPLTRGGGGVSSPFLGPSFSASSLAAEFESAGLKVGYMKNPNKMIASLLADSQIIGLARGRAEFGPRALGNRSLLANPSDGRMHSIINKAKGRELFRPLAPSVKAEKCAEYFDCNGTSSPYMSFVFNAKPPTKKIAPAIIHVDGTARVQTVDRRLQPDYWGLIDEFEKLSGFPILLNTSLNLAGRPLAATAREMTYTMKKSSLQYLAIEEYLVEK